MKVTREKKGKNVSRRQALLLQEGGARDEGKSRVIIREKKIMCRGRTTAIKESELSGKTWSIVSPSRECRGDSIPLPHKKKTPKRRGRRKSK